MDSLLSQLCAAAAHPPSALADETFARALDAQDKVIRRELFAYPQLSEGTGDCIYLCGNSLGLQPLSARTFINEELDSWAKCACFCTLRYERRA
jgi:kynureninase